MLLENALQQSFMQMTEEIVNNKQSHAINRRKGVNLIYIYTFLSIKSGHVRIRKTRKEIYHSKPRQYTESYLPER